MKAVFAAAVAVACVISGCSSDDARSSETSSVATTSARKIVSTVIDLTLPPGTTISSHSDGVEIWQTPGSQQDAIAAVKPQVPFGAEFKGATWCGERTDPKTGMLDWHWAGPKGSIDVEFGTDSSLRIEQTTVAATCGR